MPNIPDENDSRNLLTNWRDTLANTFGKPEIDFGVFKRPPTPPLKSDEELCITEADKTVGVDWRMMFTIMEYYHGREPYINCVANLCEALSLEAVAAADGKIYYKRKPQ